MPLSTIIQLYCGGCFYISKSASFLDVLYTNFLFHV